MSWLEIALFIITLLVMLVGMVGVILPMLPGVPVIFAAALIYAIITGFEVITGNILIIFGVMTAASFALDWVATAFGVKKMGGSLLGMLGAFLGMIVGLLLPGVGIIGFIIGAFIGAFVFEILIGKKTNEALRAGFGSFIGFLAGGVLKFVIGATMIGIFIYQILS
ncbi:MAG: DUF456 domain-containing protein [candidate division Zixibacteria bacterium]|nr:DUF456 domain-containing protein [candidate division Zixibacteria bacterium]